jgi:ribose 1,5-bisphosphokinase
MSGRLVYLIGASGAGKDSLMSFARDRLPRTAPIVFAHRYITRPHGAGGEDYVPLDEIEFERRLRHGCFAMAWRSHGLRYGIGV